MLSHHSRRIATGSTDRLGNARIVMSNCNGNTDVEYVCLEGRHAKTIVNCLLWVF